MGRVVVVNNKQHLNALGVILQVRSENTVGSSLKRHIYTCSLELSYHLGGKAPSKKPQHVPDSLHTCLDIYSCLLCLHARCPTTLWIAPSPLSSSVKRATRKRKGKETTTTTLSLTSTTQLSSYLKVGWDVHLYFSHFVEAVTEHNRSISTYDGCSFCFCQAPAATRCRSWSFRTSQPSQWKPSKWSQTGSSTTTTRGNNRDSGVTESSAEVFI